MNSFRDRINAEANRRLGTRVIAPTHQPGTTLPVASMYDFSENISFDRFMAELGVTGNPKMAVTKFSLNGSQSAAKMEAVGQAILEDEAKEILLAAGGNSARINKLPDATFLRRRVLEGTIVRKVAPQLLFNDMAVRTVIDAPSATWHRERNSAFDDPLGTRAEWVEEGAIPPKVIWSDPEEINTPLKRLALSVGFTDQAMRSEARGFSEVQRKTDMTAYAVAFRINQEEARVIGNGFDEPTNTASPELDQVNLLTVTTPWDDDLRDPLADIRSLALTMKTAQGYFFKPTDLLLPPKEWLDLNTYFTSVDLDWVLNPTTGEKIMMVDDIRVTETPPNSGIPDDAALLLALGPDAPPPLEIFDRPHPEFSRSGMLGVQIVREELARNRIVVVDKEFAVINRNPKAVGVLLGL